MYHPGVEAVYQRRARMITFSRKPLDWIIYITINKPCAALRIQKGMGGPLGPPKIICSLGLHQSSFFHNCKKILMCARPAECHPLMINQLEINSFCRKVKKESSGARDCTGSLAALKGCPCIYAALRPHMTY